MSSGAGAGTVWDRWSHMAPQRWFFQGSLTPAPPVLPILRAGPHPCFPACRLTGSEPLTILPLSLEPEVAAQAHYKACDRLKLERKQRRMCRRDPGVAETLVEAVSMSALECQYQFRFERWNCTLEGRYRASLLKRGEYSHQGGLHLVIPDPTHNSTHNPTPSIHGHLQGPPPRV